MQRCNIYYLKNMWVGLLGWVVLSSSAMSYGADLRLLQAVEQGNIETVRALLYSNLSRDFIMQVNDHGQTILHRASAMNRVDIVNLLLEMVGLLTQDVVLEFMAQADKNGYTAGLIASEKAHATVVEALVDKYLIILSTLPPLSTVITRKGHSDLERLVFDACIKSWMNVVRLCLSRAPQFMTGLRTNQGWTMLHVASEKGHLEFVSALLEKDSSLQFMMQRANDGWTALHLASQKGHVEVVKALLAKDATSEVVAQTASNEWTALHLAASGGHVEVVKALLANNATLEFTMKVTKHGYSALHLAAFHGRVGVVESLVSALPELLLQKDGAGASALDIAFDRGQSEVVDYLTKKIIELIVRENPEMTIPPIPSFVQLNAGIAQQGQKVTILNQQQTAFDVTEKALSREVASLQAQLRQQKEKLLAAQIKCKQNEKECEDGKKELENLKTSFEENKNKLSELVKAIEAQQKNKRPAQEALVRIKQEPEDEQKARMEHFYKKLNKKQLKLVAAILRDQSVVTNNGAHLAKGMIDFLLTGNPPANIASEEEATQRDFETLVKCEAMPSGSSGPSPKRRKLVHVREGEREDAGPSRYMLHLACDEQGDIANSHEAIDLTHSEIPSQRVAFDVLDEVLQQQAEGNPHKIAFGLINLGRERDIGKTHVSVVRQFVYFVRTHGDGVYYIDLQNRSNGKGEMIFSSIDQWKDEVGGNLKAAFDEYAFVVPMTMDF